MYGLIVKKMKKLFLLLVMASALVFVSCGTDSKKVETTKDTSTVVIDSTKINFIDAVAIKDSTKKVETVKTQPVPRTKK
jgi:uncharacterized protein YcfL